VFNSYFIFRTENNSKLHFKELAAFIIRVDDMTVSSSDIFKTTGKSHYTWFCFQVTWKFTPLFKYVIIFGLMWFGIRAILEASRSDIAVTPSVTRMNWIHWWYNHALDAVLPSTVLDSVIKMSEKHKSTSSTAIKLKNWLKKTSTEE
jgi:hypothetical protein